MSGASNARPLAIFTGYMLTASALTVRCIGIILQGSKSATSKSKDNRRRQASASTFAVFSVLAAFSLATTWYHMFCYFRWSYLDWASSKGLNTYGDSANTLLLGDWLRDTSLFKQAWASTLETAPRAWWSLQIFGFCANWSVMLAVQARKRSIHQAWAFMLLGQIVAISFAMNLSFLAVLVRDTQSASATGPVKERRLSSTRFWHIGILALNVSWALAIPESFGQPWFLWLLLGPHFLAFLPLLLDGIGLKGASSRVQDLAEPVWFVRLTVMAAIVSTATVKVMGQYGQVWIVGQTLHEHPAVSSVGWDVICCWISLAAWSILGES